MQFFHGNTLGYLARYLIVSLALSKGIWTEKSTVRLKSRLELALHSVYDDPSRPSLIIKFQYHIRNIVVHGITDKTVICNHHFKIYSSIIEFYSIFVMDLYAPRIQLISNKPTASLVFNRMSHTHTHTRKKIMAGAENRAASVNRQCGCINCSFLFAFYN